MSADSDCQTDGFRRCFVHLFHLFQVWTNGDSPVRLLLSGHPCAVHFLPDESFAVLDSQNGFRPVQYFPLDGSVPAYQPPDGYSPRIQAQTGAHFPALRFLPDAHSVPNLPPGAQLPAGGCLPDECFLAPDFPPDALFPAKQLPLDVHFPALDCPPDGFRSEVYFHLAALQESALLYAHSVRLMPVVLLQTVFVLSHLLCFPVFCFHS